MTPPDPSNRAVDPAALLEDLRWLVALARSLVQDEHAAEDVVQEARLSAWRHPPDDPAHATAWLRRIVRNVALHVRRGDARRARREEEAAAQEAQPAADELVARVEMQRAVADAVLSLAEPYRGAVLLRFFERLPPRDIAQRLNVPVETVRTRLKRALEQLRAKLDRDFGARDAWAGLLMPWFGPWIGVGKGIAAGTAATTGGVVTMKVGTKLALAAALVGAAGVATWEWRRTNSSRGDDGASHRPAAALASPASNEARAAKLPSAATDVTPVTPARTADAAPSTQATGDEFESVHLTAHVVDETTRAPLAGATLVVPYGSAQRRERAVATSNRDGRVVLDFGPMRRGSFDFEVHHADHAAFSDQVRDVPMEATQRRFERDLGDVVLERGTAVAGRVVRSPGRAPVADAPLFVIGPNLGIFNQFWPDAADAAGRTRSDGSFELPERIGTKLLVPVVYAVTPTGVGYAIFALAKGRERIDDLVVEIEPPVTLGVRVVDASGAPFPNARVAALPRFSPLGPMAVYTNVDVPMFRGEEWRPIFTATTDRDGRVALPFLPEGRDDRHLGQWGGYAGRYTIFASAKECRTAIGNVTFKKGERASVDLVLKKFVPLGVRGRVADEGGQPIADARVALDGIATTTSDEAGLYELKPVTRDQDHLAFNVTADGFGPIRQELFVSKLGERIVPIRGADGVIEREEVVVDVALTRGLSIAGRCVDETGQGVPGVGLALSRYDEARNSWIRSNAASGADGSFHVDGVVAGDWTLEVNAPDGFRPIARRTVAAGTSELDVRLLREAKGNVRLIVTVVDATTGQPADVTRAYVFPRYYGNSGKGGLCSVGSVKVDGLSVGPWNLTVIGASGARLHRDFDVTDPDQELHLQLELGESASFDATVTLADGSPLGHRERRMMVWLRALSNSMEDCGHAVDAEGRQPNDVTGACAQVEADGTFRIADVTAGVPINVYVAEKELAGDATIVLKPGEHGHLDLRLRPAGRVAFRLDEALPAGRIRVETVRADGSVAVVAQQDSARPGDTLVNESLACGPLHWRATFVSEEERIVAPRVVEGDVDVVAGQERVVAIRGLK